MSRLRRFSNVMSLLDTLRKTAKGLSVITEWLGDGGIPVPKELAEARSKCCIGCPENVAPNWWDRATGSIAMAMRAMLAVKNECEYHVDGEEDLHVCKVCGCCNRLSIWTPIDHIKAHTAYEEFKKYPSRCWKPKELTTKPDQAL